MSKGFKEWDVKIQTAHKIHKKRVQEPMERNREFYRGNQWHGLPEFGRFNNPTVDNIIFSNINTIIPSINLTNPKVFVKPRTRVRRTDKGIFDTFQAAKLVQLLANYDYKELNIKRQATKALVDSLLAPWGFMQIGYTVKTEKFKDGDGDRIEKHELIKEDNVFAVRRSPEDLRVDPEAKDHHLEDARWIALRWVKTLDEVKSNPNYKGTRNLKPNFRVNVAKMAGDAESADDARNFKENRALRDDDVWGRVEGWDIWDKTTGKLMTYVEGHDKFIQEKDWPLEYEGFPVEILYFNENPEELFPISDVDVYIDSQIEINKILSFQLDHIENLSRNIYGAKEGGLDEEEANKMVEGPNGTVVFTKFNPQESIALLDKARISQDIYLIAQQRKAAIREESGISEFEKGVSAGAETATESALLSQGVRTRRSDREQKFRGFLMRVVKKMMHVRQQTLDDIEFRISEREQLDLETNKIEKLKKIIPPEGDPILLPWVEMSKEDIQGDFDFDIEVNSTSIRNEEQEKQEAITLYQGAAGDPFINPLPPRINVLEKFNVTNMNEWLRDPAKVAQEQNQAQQAMLEHEMAKEQLQRGVDLQKTREKVAQDDRGAILRARVDEAKTNVDLSKVIADFLKDADKGNGSE